MPVLGAVGRELRSSGVLQGRRVGLALHVEAKTACLALTLKEAGAEVVVAGCNPLSTQDEVAAALAQAGVTVFAVRGATEEEYFHYLRLVCRTGPDFVVDDGGDLTALLHTEERGFLSRVAGGTEETTTGVRRIRAMEREGVLAFPVVAVNDARTKHLFDNRYGTGQSTWDGIMRATNLLVAGKTVVVVGYGWCGRGVAQRARGLGARVIVCEVDPVAAIEALHDGFEVLPSLEAASRGDVFVTATGCARVLTREHFLRMKDGALLANAGHFDVEIDKQDLAALDRQARGGSGAGTGQPDGEAGREVRPWVREYLLPGGKRLYLLAEGRLVNLVAGDGHPVEIMDMSFALQALSLGYLAGLTPGTLPPGVHPVPGELDEKVARLRLMTGGVQIDELTEEQRGYLSGWR